MRHLGSLLLGLVLGAAAWACSQIGFYHLQQARIQETVFASDRIVGVLLLLAAGLALGILLGTRLSPVGPALAGLLMLAFSAWYVLDPDGLDNVARNVKGAQASLAVFGDARSGLGWLLGMALLVPLVSPSRWRRRSVTAAPVPVAPPAGGPQYAATPGGPPPGYPHQGAPGGPPAFGSPGMPGAFGSPAGVGAPGAPRQPDRTSVYPAADATPQGPGSAGTQPIAASGAQYEPALPGWSSPPDHPAAEFQAAWHGPSDDRYPPPSSYPDQYVQQDSPQAPPYGQPYYTDSRFGDPQPPVPRYDEPRYGDPPPATRQYGESPYSESPYGEPQYGEPQYGEPRYGEPRYGEPQYGEPRYGEPRYEPSSYGQPERGRGTTYGLPAASSAEERESPAAEEDPHTLKLGRDEPNPTSEPNQPPRVAPGDATRQVTWPSASNPPTGEEGDTHRRG